MSLQDNKPLWENQVNTISRLLEEGDIQVTPGEFLSLITLEASTFNYSKWMRIQEEAGKDPNLISYNFEIWDYPGGKTSQYWIYLNYATLLPIGYSQGKAEDQIFNLKGLDYDFPRETDNPKLRHKGGLYPKKSFIPIKIYPKVGIEGVAISPEVYLKQSPLLEDHLSSPEYLNRHKEPYKSKLKTATIPPIKGFFTRIKFERENRTAVAPPEELRELTSLEIAQERNSLNYPVFRPLAERLGLVATRIKKILDEDRSYSKNEAIKEIALNVDIPETKAQDIFQKMLDSRNLERIASMDAYYISSSTPF